jgi:hypothetical protein
MSWAWIILSLGLVSLTVSAAAAQTETTPQQATESGTTTPEAGQAAKRTPAPKDAYCYIGWPSNGAIIHQQRFKVWFGLRNMGVAPAGVDRPNTGHHHLIIDAALPPLDEPVPSDKNHLHFGAGQTETVIELSPGRHTLQLLLADANHVPHDPPIYSKQIVIFIK